MKHTHICLALMAATTMASAAPWTYRGTLTDAGKAANGSYDLRLTLVNLAGTASVSQPITLNNVQVIDGNFAAEVDFGFDLSNAPVMKLKTEVQQNSSGFASLGEPSNFDPKAALAGICWDTTGNVVAAGEFLGSTNNAPVELRVNGNGALRLEPTSGGTVNITAGSSNNDIRPGSLGATVSGGGGGSTATRNYAVESYATVAGGTTNVAGSFASPIGRVSAATVSGGGSNFAFGLYSTIPGGFNNRAGGDFSFAAGTRAVTDPTDPGTFVWADSQNIDFVSTNPDQFLIRAQGGMAINTNFPTVGAALTVTGGNVSIPNPGRINFGSITRQMLNLFEESPTNYGIGVQTATLYNRVSASGGFAWFQGGSHNDAQNNPGGGTVRMTLDAAGQLRTTTGTIATMSDARLKKNVSDYTGALAQIEALRPVHYEYKDAGKSFQAPGQHLGFIAQEVQQVFPQWVSTDDEGNLMLSMRGFEAVAVRGMQELQAENMEQADEIAALKARLEALEASVRTH